MKRASWKRIAQAYVNGANADTAPYWRRYFCICAFSVIQAHSRRNETRAEAALLIRRLEARG